MSKKVISAVKIWADSIEAVSLLMAPFSHEPAKNWQTMPSGPMCVMVPSSISSGKTTKVSFLGINVENPRDSMAISPCWPSKPEDCLVRYRNPGSQSQVRVQWLCHLNDCLPLGFRCQVSGVRRHFLSPETRGSHPKFHNCCFQIVLRSRLGRWPG